MKRIVLIIAIAGSVLIGGVLALRSTRSRPDATGDPASERRVAPRDSAWRATPETAPAAPITEPLAETPKRAATPKTPPPATAGPVVEPVRDVGTLHIVSDVPEAQVFLDRQFIGATPVTATDVAPGSHQINVSAKGYDAHAQTIQVTPGERRIVVNFREIRLDAAIDVVHKHRMGSCKGRLVATAQGLRYDTTDKDDQFTAALLDIETFRIDYLEKTLSVQMRKGKRYNFTTPDGNADRLLVFHRDVDNARERLKKGDVPTGQ